MTGTAEFCRACDLSVDTLPNGMPCPRCGAVERRGVLDVPPATAIGSVGSITIYATTREFFLRNPRWFWSALAITVGPPIVGLWLSPAWSLAWGEGCGLIAFIVGLRAGTLVREMKQTSPG